MFILQWLLPTFPSVRQPSSDYNIISIIFYIPTFTVGRLENGTEYLAAASLAFVSRASIFEQRLKIFLPGLDGHHHFNAGCYLRCTQSIVFAS